ncbi:MAG: glutamate--tRNA ligase [Chlamydiia bacterium]|nr:glutamate--tRNA ligase [Chlamydiia bacterium]
MSSVRVRIAPSPTGSPHVGTAFVGLINMMFAKANKGSMILRVEDTDASRSKREYEDQMLDLLEWIGVEWQEGIDKQGLYGPYRQSDRSLIYSKYAEELLEKDGAYRCFCSQEDINLSRSINKTSGGFGYPGLCRNISDKEITERLNNNDSFVLRLKVPKSGSVKWKDLIKREIRFEYSEVDDQILIKSDGLPTYHFANVIDDHLMKITHVIRGEEWISSTPKHICLYEKFGWEMPEFGHLPLLLDENGKKLSKRKSPASIDFYRKQGFLPDVMLNFLLSICYNTQDGSEIFNVNDLVGEFSIDKISKSSAVFDIKKLDWLNKQRLKNTSNDKILSDSIDWLKENIEGFIEVAKERSINYSDLMLQIVKAKAYDRDAIKRLVKHLDGESISTYRHILDHLISNFQSIEWSVEGLKIAAKGCESINEDIKFKNHVIPCLFYAIFGAPKGLSVFHVMILIGKDSTFNRLNYLYSNIQTLLK